MLKLDNPRKGLLCDSILKYENIGLCTEAIRNHPVTIGVEMGRKGYRPDLIPDTLFISDTVRFITSFVVDTTLFSVMNSHDRTFIARVSQEELRAEYDFGEKFDFVDWSRDMDSRNNQQYSVLLKYMKGENEMGMIDINGYLPDSIKDSCIQTHFVQQVDSSLVFAKRLFHIV